MCKPIATEDTRTFTPALGKDWLAPFGTSRISPLSREKARRSEPMHQSSLVPGDLLMDVGTGNLRRETFHQAKRLQIFPAIAIEKLLRERPDGAAGLAVPGIPLGPPGTEAGGRNQPYQVIAFGRGIQRVFANYRRRGASASQTNGERP